MTADPWQLVNLYGDGNTGNDPPVQTWTQRLDSLRSCVGAACVVTGGAPVASAVGWCAGLVCTLDASGSTDDGEIVSFEWHLGDGATASGPVVEHTYAAPGDYTAVVTVTDDEGATDTVGVVVSAREAGIGFVATDGVNANAVSRQVGVPAGTLPGDVIVVSVARSTLVEPLVDAPVPLSEAVAGFNGKLFTGVWTGVADASSAGSPVTVADGAGLYGHMDVRVTLYRGVDAAAPGYRWFKLYPDGRMVTDVQRLEIRRDGLDLECSGYR